MGRVLSHKSMGIQREGLRVEISRYRPQATPNMDGKRTGMSFNQTYSLMTNFSGLHSDDVGQSFNRRFLRSATQLPLNIDCLKTPLQLLFCFHVAKQESVSRRLKVEAVEGSQLKLGLPARSKEANHAGRPGWWQHSSFCTLALSKRCSLIDG